MKKRIDILKEIYFIPDTALEQEIKMWWDIDPHLSYRLEEEQKRRAKKGNIMEPLPDAPVFPGVVYALKAREYFKIGMCADSLALRLRIVSLQIGCPFEIKLFKHWYVDDCRKIEKELHIKFRHKNIRGEWFVLDEDEVNSILDKYHFS